MKNKNLDRFKLIVILLLLLILIFLIIQKPGVHVPADEEKEEIELIEQETDKNEGEVIADQLPELPLLDGSLSLDDSGKRLVDISGVQRFVLSANQQNWKPVISEDVLAKLPDDYKLSYSESGVWCITDTNGTKLFEFNMETLEWMELPVKQEDVEDVSGTEDGGEIITCEGANPTRLTAIGSWVEVVNATIPLRSSPDANSVNMIQPLSEGTMLEIIKSPVCTSLLGGANLWWGVRTKGGIEGWAAEASAITDVYYLQEVR